MSSQSLTIHSCAFRRSFLIAIWLVLQAAALRAQYDAAAPEPIGKLRGAVVLHGGGALSDAIVDRFIELAGGKEARIVVLTAGSAASAGRCHQAMDNRSDQLRSPRPRLHGVRQIVRFNWPHYVASLLVLTTAIIVLVTISLPPLARLILALAVALVTWWTLASLVVSYWVYDHARVADGRRIARWLGHPSAARAVGYALHALPPDSEIPWQRVINAAGHVSSRCDPHYEGLQRTLLEAEGVRFDVDGSVDLQKFGWGGPLAGEHHLHADTHQQ